jgi:hypothetical protein
MAADVPYMVTIKNLGAILDRVKAAGTPPKFTYSFLTDTLGFKGSGDRGVIKILKQLGMLNTDGVPTPRYNEFRQAGSSGRTLAQGLREGWSDVFLANQDAHQLSAAQLTEIMKNVTGKGEAVARKMATTFKALADLADWNAGDSEASPKATEEGVDAGGGELTVVQPVAAGGHRGSLRLHSDVHIHLPTTSDVSVYTAIFRALREELVD